MFSPIAVCCRTWLACVICAALATSAHCQNAVSLAERPVVGQQFRVKSRGDLSGQLALPADPKASPKEPQKPTTMKLVGSSSTEYDETWLALDGGAIAKAFRIYRGQDYKRTLGDQRQESALRNEARRLVLVPQRQKEFFFSPDGPLTQQEIEQAQLDVFVPRLFGLLPDKAVKVGDTWPAANSALQELADIEVSGGTVTCKLVSVEDRGGVATAFVSFTGLLTGSSQDGPCRQRLDGTFSFNLAEQYLCDLSLAGTNWLLDGNGKEVGRIDGRFVITRRRVELPELRLADLQRLTLEPNAQNTALLLDEPPIGIRFIYPRRWTVKQADSRQVILDDGQGTGVLLTLEPLKQLPTVAQFEAEAKAALVKQKVRILAADPPRRLEVGAEPVDRFRFEVEAAQQKRLVLDYFVITRAAGGATLAANYPAGEATETAAEVERLARSLRLTPPKK